MAKGKAASLRAQWLGERLKAARTNAGYTLHDAAEYLQLNDGTLSRFESATYAVRRSYVRDLIDFYRVSDRRERDALLQLCDDAWRKDWWDGQAADIEHEFIDYAWLESRATHIRAFESALIHGLLQTREYADAVITAAESDDLSQQQIEAFVDFRMARQDVVKHKQPTRLTVILEEHALRRPVAPVRVMKAQINTLIKSAKDPHVDVRIIPVTVGWHPGTTGPFTYFEMPDPYSDVAFTNNLAGRTYVENHEKVAAFQRAYDELCLVALDSKASTRLLKTALKELE